jgi:streptomycin 3"-adenylyltransferase
MRRMDNTLPTILSEQLFQACAELERHLAETILAIHLFGSAVEGGLKPSSDVDLLATVSEAPTEAARRALMKGLLAVSRPPAEDVRLRPLEVTVVVHSQVVPWRYPPRRELQFGEWLRHDLQSDRFEEPTLDHDLAILLSKIRQHSVSLKGPEAKTLFDPVPRADLVRSLRDTVAQWNEPEDWAGDERNIVLALARCWYTASSGEIASKEAAADWLLDQEQGANRMVLSKARAAYLGEANDDLARYPAEMAAFVIHARRSVEQLCSNFSS